MGTMKSWNTVKLFFRHFRLLATGLFHCWVDFSFAIWVSHSWKRDLSEKISKFTCRKCRAYRILTQCQKTKAKLASWIGLRIVQHQRLNLSSFWFQSQPGIDPTFAPKHLQIWLRQPSSPNFWNLFCFDFECGTTAPSVKLYQSLCMRNYAVCNLPSNEIVKLNL